MKGLITKLKRKLAEWGIGNPLNALIYSDREIKEMGLTDKRHFNKGRPKLKGLWAVRLTSGVVVSKQFKEKDNAERN